jgi:hypothetical protein
MESSDELQAMEERPTVRQSRGQQSRPQVEAVTVKAR